MTQPVDDFNPDAFHLSEEDEGGPEKIGRVHRRAEVIVPSNKCESGACEI
jgi:hypothetical protein